eukprot:CAMPEP_0206411136 /NCGR_PEP_ID=MMETSP0294-20121207/33058_1 /ASSEMBLY_ACC=CAM_ASM_000327 /TAXON_ID=39354 /ORGANISM="Heterosigma akashiwo, Strain CCMP2393" /LENGTH=36 /DNA_ID= /DNA_START= /DNA_END= /DNA_ORIENTATION=
MAEAWARGDEGAELAEGIKEEYKKSNITNGVEEVEI